MLKLQFETGNEGMQTSEAIAAILVEVAGKIQTGREDGRIMDINGNSIGEWETLNQETNPNPNPDTLEESKQCPTCTTDGILTRDASAYWDNDQRIWVLNDDTDPESEIWCCNCKNIVSDEREIF